MGKKYTSKKVNPDGTTTLWGKNGYVGKLPAKKQPKAVLVLETSRDGAVQQKDDTALETSSAVEKCHTRFQQLTENEGEGERLDDVGSETDAYTVEDVETLWNITQDVLIGRGNEQEDGSVTFYREIVTSDALRNFMEKTLPDIEGGVEPEVLEEFLNRFDVETLTRFVGSYEKHLREPDLGEKLYEGFLKAASVPPSLIATPTNDSLLSFGKRCVLPPAVFNALVRQKNGALTEIMARLKHIPKSTLQYLIQNGNLEILGSVSKREDLTEDMITGLVERVEEYRQSKPDLSAGEIANIGQVRNCVLKNNMTARERKPRPSGRGKRAVSPESADFRCTGARY